MPGATKNAIVIGDSQTQAWLTGLKAALLDQGYSIHLREMPGCTIADSAINQAFSDHVPHTECPPFRQQYLDEIREKKPDVVIASSLWMEFRMAPGADSTPIRVRRRSGRMRSSARWTRSPQAPLASYCSTAHRKASRSSTARPPRPPRPIARRK